MPSSKIEDAICTIFDEHMDKPCIYRLELSTVLDRDVVSQMSDLEDTYGGSAGHRGITKWLTTATQLSNNMIDEEPEKVLKSLINYSRKRIGDDGTKDLMASFFPPMKRLQLFFGQCDSEWNTVLSSDLDIRYLVELDIGTDAIPTLLQATRADNLQQLQSLIIRYNDDRPSSQRWNEDIVLEILRYIDHTAGLLRLQLFGFWIAVLRINDKLPVFEGLRVLTLSDDFDTSEGCNVHPEDLKQLMISAPNLRELIVTSCWSDYSEVSASFA